MVVQTCAGSTLGIGKECCALGWNLLLDRGQRRASGRKRKRGRRKEVVDSSPSAVSNPRAFNAENAGRDNEEQQEKISRLQDF